MEQYYHRRLLRWAGHVSRMPMSRAPRQLLTGWVAHPRPTGSPLMTFGRTLKKALVRCGQSPDFAVWSQAAADRIKWRETCGQMTPLPRPKPSSYADQVHEIFYGRRPHDAPADPTPPNPAPPLTPPNPDSQIHSSPPPSRSPPPSLPPYHSPDATRTATHAQRVQPTRELPYDPFFATTSSCSEVTRWCTFHGGRSEYRDPTR